MTNTVLIVLLVISEAIKWEFTIARFIRARKQRTLQAPLATFTDPDVRAAYEAAGGEVPAPKRIEGEPKIPIGL